MVLFSVKCRPLKSLTCCFESQMWGKWSSHGCWCTFSSTCCAIRCVRKYGWGWYNLQEEKSKLSVPICLQDYWKDAHIVNIFPNNFFPYLWFETVSCKLGWYWLRLGNKSHFKCIYHTAYYVADILVPHVVRNSVYFFNIYDTGRLNCQFAKYDKISN